MFWGQSQSCFQIVAKKSMLAFEVSEKERKAAINRTERFNKPSKITRGNTRFIVPWSDWLTGGGGSGRVKGVVTSSKIKGLEADVCEPTVLPSERPSGLGYRSATI